MRLIVGCPVAERAWALPHWFECLAAQTRRPDGFCFVHSGRIGDDTWETIVRETDRHGFAVVTMHDLRAPHPRHDNARFATLADLRNDLLGMVIGQDADLFLSLDSDVMLEHPWTIEALEALIKDGFADVASALCFLHPNAPRTWTPGEDPAWAYNFGWLAEASEPERTWLRRPPVSEIAWGQQLRIEIPMACWLGNSKAIACSYSHHISGEDIGFAQSLRRAGVRCVVDTSLYARHVWSEADLEAEQFVA